MKRFSDLIYNALGLSLVAFVCAHIWFLAFAERCQ